jgi:hypothetical protein
MTPLQRELEEFLKKRGIIPLFYPYMRGSKIIEFIVNGHESDMENLVGHTFSNKRHRLTFSMMRNKGYACNFQPLY